MGGMNRGNEEALVEEIEILQAQNKELEHLRSYVVGRFGTDQVDDIAAMEFEKESLRFPSYMIALISTYEKAKAGGDAECFEVFVRENMSRLVKDLTTPFSVVAGKWDGEEGNCKVADSLHTLDEAIESHDKVCDYPWSFILYKGRVLELWRKDCWPSSIGAMRGPV